MEPIDAALAAIQALGPGEKLVYSQIAKRYGVERTTLARWHQGLSIQLARDPLPKAASSPPTTGN